jgi:hypothetical protein
MELTRTPSNHNSEAASLVAQYLSKSPRNASDMATGFGALRRGQKPEDEMEGQPLYTRFASSSAACQKPDEGITPDLVRSSSTPVRAPFLLNSRMLPQAAHAFSNCVPAFTQLGINADGSPEVLMLELVDLTALMPCYSG